MTPTQQLTEKLKTALAILDQGEPYAFQYRVIDEPTWNKGFEFHLLRACVSDALYEIRQIPMELATPGDGRPLKPHRWTLEMASYADDPHSVEWENEGCEDWTSLIGDGVSDDEIRRGWNDPCFNFRIRPWHEVRKAYERGEKIEFRGGPLDQRSVWNLIDIPSWNTEGFEFRIASKTIWSLPLPPKGKKWHLGSAWREEDLEGGWRPLLEREIHQDGDYVMSLKVTEAWQRAVGLIGFPTNNVFLSKTLRPLPFPEVLIPLEPEDIKQGDIAQSLSWDSYKWVYIQPALLTSEMVHLVSMGDIYFVDFQRNYRIRSVGETEWRAASKTQK